MAIDVNSNIIQKGLETIANATKVAANVTEGNKKAKENKGQHQENRPNNNTNQPHNQTVEVKVGQEHWPLPAPQIIEKKPETHIHKVFPDNRPLTPEECKLEELRIKLEQQNKEEDRKYRMMVEERAYRDRKEQLEYERKEREEEKKQMAKRRKVRYIIGGSIGVTLLGLIAADWYSSDRNSQVGRNSVQSLPASTESNVNIQAEGSVE